MAILCGEIVVFRPNASNNEIEITLIFSTKFHVFFSFFGKMLSGGRFFWKWQVIAMHFHRLMGRNQINITRF